MPDRWSDAREGISDRRFRAELLDYVERIAIALENPPMAVQARDLPPLKEFDEPIEREPYFDADATVCICRDNPKRACQACTPARLAWFYTQNPGWKDPTLT